MGASYTTSVVIPCFNCRRYIGQCLASLAPLGDLVHEVVVVDDGSREEIRDVVDQFGPHIRYIRQENLGPSAARNRGVEASTGEQVWFLDADDYLLSPEGFRAQLDVLEARPDVGLVHAAAAAVEAGGRPVSLLRPKFARGSYIRAGEEEFVDLLFGNYLTTSTVVVRRSVLDKVGAFRTDIKGPEDWEYWLRVSRVAAIAYVDRPIVAYRLHGQSITANYAHQRYFQMHMDILDCLYSSPDIAARHGSLRGAIDAKVYAGCAEAAYGGGHAAVARRYAARAMALATRNRRWDVVATCLWLAWKSTLPANLRRPLQRLSRRSRVALMGIRCGTGGLPEWPQSLESPVRL